MNTSTTTLATAVAVLTSLALAACSGGTVDDAEASPPPATAASPTFVDALSADAETLESKVLGLADALSAEQYEWRPGEGVLSAGEVFMHIAAYNYYYPSLAGAEIPAEVGITSDYATVGAFEDSRTERDAIIEALTASFDHLGNAIAAVSPESMGQEVEVFGSESTVQEAWFGAMTHVHEHLGQLIAYTRTNGVTPPWSM